MKATTAFAVLTLMLYSSQGDAQSVFDGTWRPDPQIYGPERKADAIELADGHYDCPTCTPPYKIKANGADQPVSGNPYYDSLRITIVDQRNVTKTAKKGGKTVAESELTVSADGKTLTERQTLYAMAPRPIEFTTHSVRISAGPPGSHQLSGVWRATDGDLSNHAEDTVFKVNGDTLEMTDKMGRSFAAKLDGSEAKYKGSDEFTSVSLRKIDDRTIEESDRRGGKVVKISLWSVDPDGKTMHVRFDDTQGHIQEQQGHKVE